MNTVRRERLVDVLTRNGHAPITLSAADGGSALILPFGGRIMGLFAPDSEENLLWVNPRLTDAQAAADVFASTEWVNTGGDRIWVGPEVDTHLGNLADPWSTYRVPSSVDPGAYVATQEGGAVRLRLRATVPMHRQGSSCQVEINRAVQLAPNPLRHEDVYALWAGELAYIGYEQTTTLEIVASPDKTLQVDIWSILMLPASGWMLVPTLGRAIVRDYIAPAAPDHVQAGPRSVALRIDGQKRFKIGLRAIALVGRAGYLRQAVDGLWTLVVRNFALNPSEDYIDPPWDDVSDWGYAFQAYNDDGGYGLFGELEYHTPAIRSPHGPAVRTDTSQLWAYAGGRERILPLAELLLGEGVLAGLSLP